MSVTRHALVAQRFGRRTFDQEVVCSIPGRGLIKLPSKLGLPALRVGKLGTNLTSWELKAECARLFK